MHLISSKYIRFNRYEKTLCLEKVIFQLLESNCCKKSLKKPLEAKNNAAVFWSLFYKIIVHQIKNPMQVKVEYYEDQSDLWVCLMAL